MSVQATLMKAIKIFEERNKTYGNNYIHFGKIMAALFPAGMELHSDLDFARASNIFMLASKLSRYCRNFETADHEDAITDSIVYWAFQKELDELEREILEKNKLHHGGKNAITP